MDRSSAAKNFKMVLFRVTGGKFGRVFSLGLLLLMTARVSRQQAGVSLRYGGETIPSDSFVDIDDILNIGSSDPAPTNRNPRSDVNGAALECITDLVDCCGTESDTPSNIMRTVHGNWYFPGGTTTIGFSSSGARFLENRGPNEVISGQQFNGSVRLFRRFSAIPQRGRFRCEIPNAANPSVNQILYVNILNFASRFDVPHVLISSSGLNTAGAVYSLTCSSTLNSDSIPLPVNVPTPRFVWSFGPSGSDPLPSGITDMGTTSNDNITFTSTLQFSPLSQCHIGSYTCRLGPARLVTSTMVTVNGFSPISVQITANGTPILGQNGYFLTCNVAVDESLNPSIAYQWTKNNGTQSQVGADRVLSFSPLRLSDAGRYTCQATVSPCSIIIMDTQDVTLQIPAPTVILSSSIPNPIPPFGSDVTLTCAVELSPAVDVPVTVNTVLTRPDGFMLTSTAQPVMGSNTNYAATFTISSFRRSDSGIYSCSTTITLTSNAYISDSNSASHAIRATMGVYLALRGVHITTNSNINISNVGQTSDNPNGALQCITDIFRCCIQVPLGEWYQPNGVLVQGTTSTTAFYRTRGANGEVSLNRPSGVESPTGRFCCEVPGRTTNQTLCVNIGGISLSIIIPSDPPIAGESYTLECSAGGSEGTFQWLGPPDGRTPVVESRPRVTITSNATSSQLQFRPVQQTDNGSYSCSATVDGSTSFSDSLNVIINAPPVSFQVTDSGATPTAGESYQLTCSVSGAENINPTTTYRWTRNSGSGQTQVGANSNTLSFTPLRLADAASYVCGVTVSSSYLASDITAMNSFDVRIQFPSPSSIILVNSDHSSRPNFLPVLGSDVTLTCTLELHSAIVPSELLLLMVDTHLSRDGTLLALTGPTVSGTTFTYTRQFESFGRSDSGNYTCTATVGPDPTFTYITGNETLSTTVNIKATSAPPVDVRATQSGSSAPVEVSWSPPSDGDNIITGYRIFYGSGKNASLPAVATSIGLRVNGNYVGQNISVRSEADQLYSELVSTSVTVDNSQRLCAECAEMQRSCSSEVGIAIGVIIVAECLVVMVITISVVLYLWRKRSTHKNTDNKNIAVSANMAYGEVTLKPAEMMSMEGEYENPDKILKPLGQWSEATAASNYETIDTSKQPAMEQPC